MSDDDDLIQELYGRRHTPDPTQTFHWPATPEEFRRSLLRLHLEPPAGHAALEPKPGDPLIASATPPVAGKGRVIG